MDIYKTKEIRKKESIDKLRKYGIDYIENLPLTYDVNEVNVCDVDDIAKRYIANIISIQVAFDLLNDVDVNKSLEFFGGLLDKYEVRDFLNKTEKKIFSKNLKYDDLVNITWQYECINVLAWVLGLKKDLEFPNSVCNVKELIGNVVLCDNFNDFVGKCKLIDIEDILDELDVEYRYHWALVDKRINPSTSVGDLNVDVVVERRRALEWLFFSEEDWNNIVLDT